MEHKFAGGGGVVGGFECYSSPSDILLKRDT